MTAVVREIERTYDITGVRTLRLDNVPGVASVSPPVRETLDAVYYDTRDLRLIRGGVTLRQRVGGADAGWHLKLPAGPDARDEFRLPPGEPGGPVPGELAALVRARTRGTALAPVARIRTVRERRQLLDEAGRPLADVARDKVSAKLADATAATSWVELEVELVGGTRDLLVAVDERLHAAGARPAPTRSKLARALADRLGMAPGGAPPGDGTLTPHSAAGDIVLAYLSRQVRAIVHYDPLVRRDEPDAVHQMRVATRRARSALQTFGTIVDDAATGRLCDELKSLATVLGRARDAEVLLERFGHQLAAVPAELLTGPIAERITGYLRGEHARAHAEIVRELDGPRYLALLGALDRLVEHPPLTQLARQPGATALTRPVLAAARRLKRALERIPDTDADVPIHEARKAAKRARYVAEAAAPALGHSAKRQAASSKALQTLLGDHQDSVVARAFLRDRAQDARAAGEDTFSYGILHEREACRAREIEHSLAERREAGGSVTHATARARSHKSTGVHKTTGGHKSADA